MDDLISRQAAIKAIDDLPNCNNGYSDTYDKACIIGVLEELPSVKPKPSPDWNGWENGCGRTYDVQPKKGKWIKHVDEECEEANWYECPNCHRFKRIATLYCPFCGSKNEGYVWADNCGAMTDEDIRKAYGTKNMLFNCGARMTE